MTEQELRDLQLRSAETNEKAREAIKAFDAGKVVITVGRRSK